MLQRIVDRLEADYIPRLMQPAPVFLSGHGLYPNWRQDPSLYAEWLSFNDVMFAIDGNLSCVEIAKKINCNAEHVFNWCDKFHSKDLLKKYDFKLKRDRFTKLG